MGIERFRRFRKTVAVTSVGLALGACGSPNLLDNGQPQPRSSSIHLTLQGGDAQRLTADFATKLATIAETPCTIKQALPVPNTPHAITVYTQEPDCNPGEPKKETVRTIKVGETIVYIITPTLLLVSSTGETSMKIETACQPGSTQVFQLGGEDVRLITPFKPCNLEEISIN
jgi:hypothetical protein